MATSIAYTLMKSLALKFLVPGRNSILSWVNSFRECGRVTKPRNGLQRTIRTPENVERDSMSLLRQHFPDRLISLRDDLQWPPRSPDLTPCDFFLWGYLKSLVYVDRPRTIAHLKNNIRDAIANIPIDMLQRVDTNFKNRLHQCIRNGGRHLPDVIFKTMKKKLGYCILK